MKSKNRFSTNVEVKRVKKAVKKLNELGAYAFKSEKGNSVEFEIKGFQGIYLPYAGNWQIKNETHCYNGLGHKDLTSRIKKIIELS